MSSLDLRSIWAELSQSDRLYRLEGPGSLQKLRVEGWIQREGVSELGELRIVCLSLDAKIELKSLIGQNVALDTVLADGRILRRSGLIRQAESRGAEGGLARYRLSVVPWLWLATQQGRSRVFHRQRVRDIIEQVLAPYANDGSWRTSDEIDAFLQDAPVREYCTQYRESDHQFLMRLLTEEGLGWREQQQILDSADTDPDAPIQPSPLILFATSAAQPQDASSPVRYHRQGALEESDAVQALTRHLHQGVAQVSLAVWDVDAKRRIEAAAPTRWSVGGPNAARIEYDDILGVEDHSRGWRTSSTVQRYANLLMEAVECRTDSLRGRSSVRTLQAGHRLNVQQAPALHLPEPCELFLDRIEHLGLNNLPKQSREDIEKRLGSLQAQLDFDQPPLSPQADPDILGVLRTSPIPGIEDDFDGFASGFDHSGPFRNFLNPQAAPPDPDRPRQPARELWSLAQQHGYANSFAALRAERPWRPVVADAQGARLHAQPTAQGVHSAIAVGPQGETSPSGADELYCNARGDIRVRFHWQEPGESTRWVRVAQRQAGRQMGWQWLPRIGQEVLIQFTDNDVDQPVCVGTVFNGRGEAGIAPSPGGKLRESDTSAYAEATDHFRSAQTNLVAGNMGGHAPPWHGAAPGKDQHRNSAAQWGFKSKEFGGSGYNQLVFDDTPNQLRVQLASSTAYSQLNLGHLIHTQDNYRGSFRSQGFELRSDAYTSIRGGAGVLLSTYHGPGGKKLEPAGDIAAGIALFNQNSQLGQTLAKASKTHLTVPIAGHVGALKADASLLDQDRAALEALHHTVKGSVTGKSLEQAQQDASDKLTTADAEHVPHTSDPIIALTAKGGLAAIAGQQLQMVAGEGITLQTGGAMNWALADEFRVHSGQAIGWLAGASKADDSAGGLAIIAAKDDITVQAQHGELKLQARDSLTLQSTDSKLELAAAKFIRIATAGGASMTITQDGRITFACPGIITYHSSRRLLDGPGSMDYKLPEHPEAAPLERRWVLRRFTDGYPLPNQKYRLTLADGRVIEGKSNAQGQTDIAEGENFQYTDLKVLDD